MFLHHTGSQFRGYGDPIPPLSEWMLSFFVYSVVEEIGFYYLHRLAHYPGIYARIHKLHHEWKAPVAITAIYATYPEHILVNLLPLMVGPYILKSHVLVALAWHSIAIVNTLLSHSGYRFANDSKHDLHHEEFNVNFGVFGVLDYLHGTHKASRTKSA